MTIFSSLLQLGAQDLGRHHLECLGRLVRNRGHLRLAREGRRRVSFRCNRARAVTACEEDCLSRRIYPACMPTSKRAMLYFDVLHSMVQLLEARLNLDRRRVSNLPRLS